MKESPGLYLSAREAAAELAVSPATLYAYVSRGLVRSEPSPDSRARRYHAADVRALKAKRAPQIEPRSFRSFDADLPVLDTQVSTITARGPVYRGVEALALAERDTLEHAATLLWDATAIDPFEPGNMPVVSEAMRAIAHAALDAAAIDRTIGVLALAASADPRAHTRAASGRALAGGRILRLVTASMLGCEPSPRPLHRQIAQAWADGDAGAVDKAADLIRRALVLLADHELNVSTFTVRCAASTGLSLYDAVIAGLAAVKGPRHGGASALASQLVARFGEGDVTAQVREHVALGERFPGFGHGVYREGDPRAFALLAALARAGADPRLTRDIPAAIAEASGEFANIDYALAAMMHTLRQPPGREAALFAIARTVGWIAHASEQLAHGGLIRPRARYVGPMPRGAA